MTEEVTNNLKLFKGLMLDADGVWFTGAEGRLVLPGGEVVVAKTRDHQDGQGLSFLRALGIRVVFASGEGEPLNSVIAKLNALPSAAAGAWPPVECFTNELKQGGKAASLEVWLKKHGLTWAECVYIGDDRSDLEAMQKAGLKVAPHNAARVIQKVADLVLACEGGHGAVREFAEMVLDARGIDEAGLPTA